MARLGWGSASTSKARSMKACSNVTRKRSNRAPGDISRRALIDAILEGGRSRAARDGARSSLRHRWLSARGLGAHAQEAVGAQCRSIFGDAVALLGDRYRARGGAAMRDEPLSARHRWLRQPGRGAGRAARRWRDDLRPGLDQPSFRQETELPDRPRQRRDRYRARRLRPPGFLRDDLNKQLNFLQHVMTVLAENGKAAVVMPDNVLFEGGGGETIRRRLLHNFDFHTLLRLPTGIFYKQGVKANVLFFDKKRVSAEPNTKELWIYDLRTNQRFTLKERPMTRADLDDFIVCYRTGKRRDRSESERFRRFAYAELVARDKVNLDIFWLKDDTLDDPDLLPPPDEIAAEIVENLESALDRFRKVALSLQS